MQDEGTVVGLVSPVGTVSDGIFITKSGESAIVQSKLKTADGFELSVVQRDPFSISLDEDFAKVHLNQKAYKPNIDGFPEGSELVTRSAVVTKTARGIWQI